MLLTCDYLATFFMMHMYVFRSIIFLMKFGDIFNSIFLLFIRYSPELFCSKSQMKQIRIRLWAMPKRGGEKQGGRWRKENQSLRKDKI